MGRSAFLEGLRNRLRSSGLRPKMPSGWDEADVAYNSTLFWLVRMVAYDAWGTFYLRLACRLRFIRVIMLRARDSFRASLVVCGRSRRGDRQAPGGTSARWCVTRKLRAKH